MKKSGYDIVGDIHGHADELIALLESMGYQLRDGCYRHESRQVIFLGDFIDRGPQQLDVLNIAMSMIENKAALAVMGNHEFNALAFHTPHPDVPGTWLRPRNNKNIHQHLRFLDELLKTKDNEIERILNFFWSLPLWLDLEGLRVVHACWEPRHMAVLGNDSQLSMQRLVKASTKGTVEYHAIEALLKGVEYDLPDGLLFQDKDGHVRSAMRTQWWHNRDSRMADIVFPIGGLKGNELGEVVVSANDLVGYPADEKPVFIGHYWLDGVPARMADNVACLDYSVAMQGKLVAYRWDGEQILSDARFVHAR